MEVTFWKVLVQGKVCICLCLLASFNFIYSRSINPDLVTKTMDMEVVKNNNVINISVITVIGQKLVFTPGVQYLKLFDKQTL
jgi:hypothetical protein